MQTLQDTSTAVILLWQLLGLCCWWLPWLQVAYKQHQPVDEHGQERLLTCRQTAHE